MGIRRAKQQAGFVAEIEGKGPRGMRGRWGRIKRKRSTSSVSLKERLEHVNVPVSREALH